MEIVAENLKTRICELIGENYNDAYFILWVQDAWHAGFPTLYVDVVFGTLDTERKLRARLGDGLYNDLQKKIETMGEHVTHALSAFIDTVPTYEEKDIYRFVSRLIDSQLLAVDVSLFSEEEED
jgi:hypothetical protein